MLLSRRIVPAVVAWAALSLLASTSEAVNVLLVGNAGTNSILEFDATTGAPVGSGTFAKDPTLDTPFGLWVDQANNYLYVASLGNGTIDRFNLQTGTAAPATGQSGAIFLPLGVVNYPNNIVIQNNTMYVTSFTNNSIVQIPIGTTGNHDPGSASTFVTVTSTATNGAHPTGMVFDTNANDTNEVNNFFVSVSNPTDQDHIAKINQTGTSQTNFNHNGTPGTTLVAPAGLAIQAATTSGGEGKLWASSFDNAASNPAVASHVAAYRYNLNNGNEGKVITNITSSLLNQPAGLLLDNSGHIFVANSGNNNILEFNTSDGSAVGSGIFIAAGTNGLNLPLYMATASITSPPLAPNAFAPLGGGGIGTLAIETPEPSSIVSIATGIACLAGLACARRRRRR